MEKFSDILNVPLGWLINLFYSFTKDYVLALLFFAIVVKLILLPFGIKQHSNSLKQARMRPKEAAIVKKYAGRSDRVSQQKKQEEIQRLYQSENYSQFAGCLPMLIQIPIVMCIYGVVKGPLRYICGLPSSVVKLITDKAGTTDQIAALNIMRDNFSEYAGLHESIAALEGKLPDFYTFGIDLSKTPQIGLNILILIPILTFVATFFSSKIIRKFSYQSPQMQQTSPDAKISMTIMDFTMPLLSTYITFKVPAVIGIYWIYNNLLGVLQQIIMVKLRPYPVFTAEDYKEAERLIAGKSVKRKKKSETVEKDPDRPRVRSLHHIDDDEYNAKVVDTSESEKKKEKTSESGLLSPMPMKDARDDNKKSK